MIAVRDPSPFQLAQLEADIEAALEGRRSARGCPLARRVLMVVRSNEQLNRQWLEVAAECAALRAEVARLMRLRREEEAA